jgi:hypothetical protein
MTLDSGEATGELVQKYIRLRWNRASSREVAQAVGQQLEPALRSRIDVLGTDAEELLNVAADSVIQKLQILEEQAALEDRGIIEQANRSSGGSKSQRKPVRHPYARRRKQDL